MTEVKTPVALPPGWIAEADSRGVVLTRVDEDGIHLGYATVSEETRGYKLGVQIVRDRDEKYQGRGWKVALYQDAIAALQRIKV